MANMLVQTWQRLLQFDRRPWVAFENGTCVVLTDPADNIEERAQAILGAYRSTAADAAAPEMGVVTPYETPGWVVRGHDPNVLTYVSFEEAGGPDMKKEEVDRVGRAKLEKDAQTLKIIHVEAQLH
jgi:hypothetical protein